MLQEPEKNHIRIGLNYYKANMYKEALQHLLKVEYRLHNSLRYTLAVCQLSEGDIVNGMKNYFYRWESNGLMFSRFSSLQIAVPYLHNWKDIVGKRLFVIFEQGFGDDIMFSHVLKYARRQAADITYMPRNELSLLMENNANVKIQAEVNCDVNSFDFIVTTGDLFRLYCIEYGKFPELTVFDWWSGGRGKIGVCHSCGTVGNAIEERKVPFKYFEKLHDIVSPADILDLTVGRQSIGVHPDLPNFQVTAEHMRDVSFMVTVDTAVAHLAQAMGIPTFLLYDHYLDWRFRCNMYKYVTPVCINRRKEIDGMYTNIRDGLKSHVRVLQECQETST